MTKLPEGLTITPCRTPGQEGASTSRQEGTKQQGVDVEEILLDLQIGFASNDTSLNTSATEKLDGTLEYLKNEPGLKDAILIEGYADATGSSRYNQQLSLRRAEIVRDYLIDHGVDRSRISVFGFGESCPWLPFSPEHDENRRVRIVSCAGSGAEIDRCRTVSVRPAMPGPDQRQ
jgi:outer membrane protein OmpA-like peptidoglycan-associated protein